ncbi:MAG TPA: HAMP domain-containing sensor histidine kinase [Nitrosopumilaceae archaeon]|nr:HAMP domain-containing sensor histidine kinase [Nitrosopumilaceae archaeon]
MMQHNKNRLSDLTEFINIASHEMRTPVQSILTHAEFLYNRPEKYTKEYAQIIFRNAMRLQTLCNNLLDVNRIERQTLKLKKEKFDLTELVSYIIQDFKSSIENSLYDAKNIKLSFESAGEIIVEADKDRISQVITNLIDNAFKFTEVGSIKITLEKKDETAVITVKDTGSGIDPHVLSDLFSKFMTISVKGTGLGLFVSKNIIEEHGGNIWAKNNSDGKGASFIFVIPNNSSGKYKICIKS